jgi:hypothetical protein
MKIISFLLVIINILITPNALAQSTIQIPNNILLAVNTHYHIGRHVWGIGGIFSIQQFDLAELTMDEAFKTIIAKAYKGHSEIKLASISSICEVSADLEDCFRLISYFEQVADLEATLSSHSFIGDENFEQSYFVIENFIKNVAGQQVELNTYCHEINRIKVCDSFIFDHGNQKIFIISHDMGI